LGQAEGYYWGEGPVYTGLSPLIFSREEKILAAKDTRIFSCEGRGVKYNKCEFFKRKGHGVSLEYKEYNGVGLEYKGYNEEYKEGIEPQRRKER
jgi:hypothetical protein